MGTRWSCASACAILGANLGVRVRERGEGRVSSGDENLEVSREGWKHGPDVDEALRGIVVGGDCGGGRRRGGARVTGSEDAGGSERVDGEGKGSTCVARWRLLRLPRTRLVRPSGLDWFRTGPTLECVGMWPTEFLQLRLRKNRVHRAAWDDCRLREFDVRREVLTHTATLLSSSEHTRCFKNLRFSAHKT